MRIELKLQSIVSLCGFSVSELRNAYQISLTSLFFSLSLQTDLKCHVCLKLGNYSNQKSAKIVIPIMIFSF